jgi:1-acyl-sn-glycerol-3-phosphate acyltransferase
LSTLYSIGKVTVAPLMRTVWRPTVTGLEHVPSTGPTILGCNHLSVVDSILIPVVMPRQVYYLAKEEYFTKLTTRALMRGLNQIPVDRSGGRASLMALDAALPILQAGHVLGIHPEGTRSPDGRLYRGRPGVAKLALDAGATVVPVGILGTEHIQPIGARLPRIGPKVEVRVGPPLDLSPWRDQAVDSSMLREITAYLMREIQKLTGQEYVGRYAPRKDATAD